MNTQITSKLAALAVALLMNSVIMGGIAYLFSGPNSQQPTALAAVHGSAYKIGPV
jgi:hypothetical protein